MNQMSIKSKLMILVISGLVFLGVIVSFVSYTSINNSLLKTQLNQLTSIKSAKLTEVENYFGELKGLLTSLATQEGTIEAFEAFDKSFYKLQSQTKLDIKEIRQKLIVDFENNYLNSVNYNVPNSKQQKITEEYLPKDPNAIIAQYIFITQNGNKLGEKNNLHFDEKFVSDYMNAHKKYHSSFDKILKSFSLYDIFMVDLKGNLIYTDFKEKDYATNLINGIYSNTGIARVYKKALDLSQGEIAFDDFEPYEPSYNSAASFIATPIIKNGQKLGVLIFQMPVDVINDMMSFGGKYEESGLGYSGECYLVGPDFKMRNNSRFTNDINDPVVKALGSTIGIWKVQTDSTKAVLQKGEASGKWLIDDYRGVSVLSVYGTIKIFDQVNWAIVAELDEEEALSDAVTLVQIVLIGTIICILITLVVFVMGINRLIVKPLHQFKDGLLGFFAYLNREKSDVQPLVVSSQDEIGLMSYVINQNIQTTKSNIEQDKKVILDTISVLQEFEQGDLSQRVKTSTSNPALQELTNLLNQMGEHLEENIDKVLNILEQYSQYNYLNKVKSEDLKAHLLKLANGVNGLGSSITSMLIDNKQNAVTLGESSTVLLKNVDTLNTNSNEAAVALEQTASALEQITGNITQTNESITKMESYAQGVTNSVQKGRDLATNTATSMDEINFQVNSMNDAITVIDQIAFQTNILSLNAAVEAATAGEAGKGFAVVAGEVRNLATRSAEAANEIKKLVQSAREKANVGKEIADQMIDGYNHLFESINHTIVLIKDVSVASNEQKTGIIQINDAINALDKQTQQNADIASQTKQIAVQTDTIAKVVYEETQKKQFENKQSDQRTQRINLEYTGTERRKLESNIKKSVLIEKPTNDMLHTKQPQEQKVAKVTPVKSNIPEDDEWASF